MSALHEAEARLAALGRAPFALPLGRMSAAVEAVFSGFGQRGWVVAGPRERVGAVLRGCPVERLVDSFAGARPYKLAPVSAAPGNRALHAVGLALASGEPVLCLLGLASAANGAFHEALNTTALTGAPVIFAVLVEPIAAGAPVGPQLSGSAAAIAAAHGLRSQRCSAAEARAIVAAAREANAPFLLEINLE